MITKEQIYNVQKKWGNSIIEIGNLKNDFLACEKKLDKILEELYAFEKGPILFKPTKASQIPFRSTKEGTKSYFIGGNEQFPEDHGFALQQWGKVRFENKLFLIEEKRAIVMGNYFFYNQNNEELMVEFTFGYWQNEKNELKIDIHHSSIPYQPCI